MEDICHSFKENYPNKPKEISLFFKKISLKLYGKVIQQKLKIKENKLERCILKSIKIKIRE